MSIRENVRKSGTHEERVLKKAAKKHLERLIGSDTRLPEIDGDTVAAYRDTGRAEDASASAIRQELAIER